MVGCSLNVFMQSSFISHRTWLSLCLQLNMLDTGLQISWVLSFRQTYKYESLTEKQGTLQYFMAYLG